MPDTRHHRGAHPEDAALFSPRHWPALRAASRDLWWLLDRGYALRSALALTGDRYELSQRQRLAVARGACSAAQLASRQQREVDAAALADVTLWIDGYNLLITIEAALAAGIILAGRDGCYRDMASLHGSYRNVSETLPALQVLGEVFTRSNVSCCHWVFDRPVANSGRLKGILEELARAQGWQWDVHLDNGPDKVLAAAGGIVASSDSVVLDRCGRWFNAARHVMIARIPHAQVIALGAA
jgi:hypothetical protein